MVVAPIRRLWGVMPSALRPAASKVDVIIWPTCLAVTTDPSWLRKRGPRFGPGLMERYFIKRAKGHNAVPLEWRVLVWPVVVLLCLNEVKVIETYVGVTDNLFREIICWVEPFDLATSPTRAHR